MRVRHDCVWLLTRDGWIVLGAGFISHTDHDAELAKLTGLSRRSTDTGAGETIVSPAGAAAAPGDRQPRQHRSQEERDAAKEKRRKEAKAKDLADELKYTADHVVALVVPVSITMAAVVATVKSISYYAKQGENLA
jgi:hypothetical protein